MKVLFIANKTSNHATRWANELCERGYEIFFVSVVHGKKKLDKDIKYIKLKYGKYHGYILNYFHLEKIIKNFKPDIIHAHYANGNALLGVLSNFKPLVISVYGSDILIFPEKNVINKFIVKNNINRADWICSTSEVMKNKIFSMGGQKNNLTVIPFGVDLNKFKKFSLSQNHSDKLIIGTVKKIEDVYGIDVLINSFNELLIVIKSNKLCFDLQLVIAGNGSKMEEMKALTTSLGIQSKVKFLGNIEHERVPEILNSFDVFVALSRSESFGVSVVEASACELPVVVSNVGGLPEVVDDQNTGIIVKNENINEAKEALLKLISNKDLRLNLGKAGRKKVENLYDWKKNVDLMEEVYQELV